MDDRERAFYGPRAGDLALLGLLTAVLLGNGLYIWHRLGPKNHETGSAIFWGLALLCSLWAIIVYTFKLSVSVRVGPHGVSITRGPWQTELAWAHVGRLVERMQVDGGQRRRWVVALARDGRQLQVREDMVADYQVFRRELYERYRLWRDHGGTWGTTSGGPYRATETSSAQTRWLLVLAAFVGLPGLYFWTQIHGARLLGALLLALAFISLGFSVRSVIRRQTYLVDPKAIDVRQLGRSSRLAWRDVARVERSRIAFSGLVQVGIVCGRLALRVASRRDGRVQSFDWYPRIPEYLILRGAGRQVRVRLHKLARPDEMLAWVEFYERQGRRRTDSSNLRKSAPLAPRRTTNPLASDYTVEGGPTDPWGADRQGAVDAARRDSDRSAPGMEAPTESGETIEPSAATPEDSASWLSADTGDVWSPGRPLHRVTPNLAREHDLMTTGASWTRPETDDPPAPGVSSAIPAETSWRGGERSPISDERPAAEEWTAQPEPDWSQTAPEYEDVEPAWTAQDVARWENQEWHEQQEVVSSPDSEATEWEVAFPDDEAEDDAPTASVEPPALAFAPWREDAEWQPPRFPRYGPPVDGSSDEQS